MISKVLIVVFFWICTSRAGPVTWSSNINSIISIKSLKSSEIVLNEDLMKSIEYGSRVALETCQNKFKWDRWNCSEAAFSRGGRQPATKETAFLLAITSAGILHSITQNCSRGELKGCGCDLSLNTNTQHPLVDGRWNWRGCSDNLDYGTRIVEAVLDELEVATDPQAYANLHNSAAGRMAVRVTMQKHCRCHGVSGSCTLQTCWMQMASFNEIADTLRRQYEQARRLDLDPSFNSVGHSDITKDVPEEELVYLLDSPNYCEVNLISGTNGTKGRECSRKKGDTIPMAERKSCKNLCRTCGHRVRRERQEITRRCNCTFRWCCEVKCDYCTQTVERFFCG